MCRDEIVKLNIERSQIRDLSKLNPCRSTIALLFDWGIICIGICIPVFVNYPAFYLLSWLLIGTRMYALYSLLHDGIHYLLFPNKKLNDWICRLFLAGPLFISLDTIRKFHFLHHQHLKTHRDPETNHLQYSEFQFPKSTSGLLFIFLKDITGINFIYYKIKKIMSLLQSLIENRGSQKKNILKDKKQMEPVMLLYYTAVILLIIYMNWEIQFLLYWFIPYITLYQTLNRLRLSTEHFHLPANKIFETRTVQLNLFERFIFSPHHLGFHTEHHLYPSIPFYHLPLLHNKLMKVSGFEENLLINKSYFTVLKNYIK